MFNEHDLNGLQQLMQMPFRSLVAFMARFQRSNEPQVSFNWRLSVPEQAKFYAENGFLVIPGALTRRQVDQALREISNYGLKGTTEDVWEAPFARALVTNPKLLAALKAIFGEQIKFFKAAYVETLPKKRAESSAQRQALHVDYGIGELERDFRNSTPSWVNVAFYLTELSADHSPLWVCPGSNRDYGVVPSSNLDRFAPSAKMVLAKAGDAVLFHANTVHAASHNFSDRARHALFYSYRPAWAKPIGPVVEWPRDFVESFPLEHQPMLRDMNRGLE
jgi:hypothetical protein